MEFWEEKNLTCTNCVFNVQEEAKPAKKLKLVHKPPTKDAELNLQGTSSSHETLQRLLAFEDNFPTSGENICNLIRELLDHYRREKESIIRWKIASILGKLAKLPGYNAESLVDEVISLLKLESMISDLI